MELPEIFCLFDTEFTAWEGSQETGWSKNGEEKEIIQMSAILVKRFENKLFIIDDLNLYVKPNINKILSDYITNLTGITNKKIDDDGIHFMDAIEKFYKFCFYNNKNIQIFSYGNDYSIIKENLKLNNVNIDSKYFKWEKSFYDIRDILEKYNIPTKEYTSGTLYKYFNINEISDVHNSEWDVLSIFYSLCKLIEIYN